MPEVEGCVTPARGPISEPAAAPAATHTTKEAPAMTMARVGQAAPDFETTAYIAGEGFKNVKLSDYRGHWVLLCFYPGDFTFV